MEMVHRIRNDNNDSRSSFPSSHSTCMGELSGVDAFFVFSGGCQKRTCGPSEWISGFKVGLNPKHEIQSCPCLPRQFLSADTPGSMDAHIRQEKISNIDLSKY